MDVLCFDVASGGVSGARIDEHLNVVAQAESPWKLTAITPPDIQSAFRRVADALRIGNGAAAISIASFMHGFLVTDEAGLPVSPVFTWLDTADEALVERIRAQMGPDFHQRTGCRFHPMFPVFKLAGMKVSPSQKVVSPKAWLVQTLTGEWAEDFGMASASGLLNIHTGEWDPGILGSIALNSASLPHIADRETIIGKAEGVPVINGSGDGFMTALGSLGETLGGIAVTLGTSASARTFIRHPVLSETSGTFCYRANGVSYLLGCAGNNGGNVLEWGRQRFGPLKFDPESDNVPIFLPTLNGERSPDWNSKLRASFQDISNSVTQETLKQSILEGVVFNLAHYTELLNAPSSASQVVLSGNGFLERAAGRILASVIRAEVLQPADVGLATLHGLAVAAWRALGHDPMPALETVMKEAARVAPFTNRGGLAERYERYKQLRARAVEL